MVKVRCIIIKDFYVTEVKFNSELYPKSLQNIPNPPKKLYMQGNLGLLNNPIILRTQLKFNIEIDDRVLEQIKKNFHEFGNNIVRGSINLLFKCKLKDIMTGYRVFSKTFVKNIGVVFGQRSQLWWDVPVMDSFELLKDIYKIPTDQFKETLELLNKALNIEDLLGRPLRQLSLGQKMKCELAGSLLHRPKILFLDEPTIGLDAVTKLAVRDFIKFINKEWNTTIILTTHDMNDIEALTNKIILIGKGRILYQGSFENIKEKYSAEKTIEVEFAKDYQKVSLAGYKVVEHNQRFATLKTLPKTQFHTTDFVNQISKKYEVVDFQVSSLSVDEILAKLYNEYEL